MLDVFCMSFKNVFKKRLRTILTIFGISVGVASVMLINTISEVGIKSVNNELDALGLNGISVTANKSEITNSDLKLIKNIDGVKNVMPIMTDYSKASFSGFSEDIVLWGVDSNVKQAVSVEILHGREFKHSDVLSRENVCLVDETVAKKLFGRVNVVGKTLKLKVGTAFEPFYVIGIARADSGLLKSVAGDLLPCFCYVPYTTMQSVIGTNELNQIAVRLDSENLTKKVSKTIQTELDYQKGIFESVSTGDLATQRKSLNNLLDIITVVFGFVGVISLFVSGLGIMTVMLVSVNERTREIGIKKAIGARFSNILFEFLTEALIICLIGSLIGCALGAGVVFIGSFALKIQATIPISAISNSVLSAIAVGVIFGLFPAMKAASLSPVQALRYE